MACQHIGKIRYIGRITYRLSYTTGGHKLFVLEPQWLDCRQPPSHQVEAMLRLASQDVLKKAVEGKLAEWPVGKTPIELSHWLQKGRKDHGWIGGPGSSSELACAAQDRRRPSLDERYVARVGMCSWRQGRSVFGLTLTKIDIWQPGRMPWTSWYQSNEHPEAVIDDTVTCAINRGSRVPIASTI